MREHRSKGEDGPSPLAAAPPSQAVSGELAALTRAFLMDAMAIAIGVFTKDGAPLLENQGMRRLLGGAGDPGRAAARLVSPSFAQLAAAGPGEAPIYRGILHFGDLRSVAHSVRGEVFRIGDELLILAEFDVVELERIVAEVSALNSRISGLQRRLVSEQKCLERSLEQLRATQAMLVHAEKMSALGKLAAGMAHEINNPLAFVRSNVHTLGESLGRLLSAYEALEAAALRGGPGEDVAALAGALREEADLEFLREDIGDLVKGTLGGLARVQKIVEDLRTFARLDGADVEVADLREVLESTLAIAGPALKGGGVQVTVEADGLPGLRCKPAELSQVFLNLLINAAQAVACRGRGNGRIAIRARDDGPRITLEFEDNGAGMTEDVLGRIFDPFFTTKPVGQGTGLGLTISHKIIVDQHGGTIAARSTPGAGSTFTITLPKELDR